MLVHLDLLLTICCHALQLFPIEESLLTVRLTLYIAVLTQCAQDAPVLRRG